jgi:hypothetical protein
MPVKQAEEFVEQAVRERPVERDVRPIRVRVFYLGAMRNKSVALKGSLLTEHFEDPAGTIERPDRETKKMRKYIQKRKVVEGGITSYDFSTHDAKGDLIRTRIGGEDVPEQLRGKRFEWVEHPAHIAEFHLGPKGQGQGRKRVRGEFEVRASAQDMPLVERFIAMARRREGKKEADLKEVLAD